MAVFDQFAKNYNEGLGKAVRLSGFGPEYFHEYKCREMSGYLASRGVSAAGCSLLNFGCGVGSSEPYLRRHLPGASIYSVDVSEESIRTAQETNRGVPGVHFAAFDGTNVPFDIDFDLIFVANVFHHIRRDKHLATLKMLKSRLKEGGRLFLFELNPINPMTMWVFIRNDFRFDKDANPLTPFYARRVLRQAGFEIEERRYTIFFPGFVSFLLPLEKYLRKFPLGAHYYYVAK